MVIGRRASIPSRVAMKETGFAFVIIVIDIYEEIHEDSDREQGDGDDIVIEEGREQYRGEVCGRLME